MLRREAETQRVSTRRPRRRPQSDRRPAPVARSVGQDYGPLSRATAPLNRWIYPTPVGRWLRRRLEGALTFQEVEVPLARCGPALDGLRIAFLSDVHVGAFMEEDDFARICQSFVFAEGDSTQEGGP